MGWGKTGQQEGIGDYTYIPVFKPNTNSHALYPVLGDGTTYRPQAYNAHLTWEKTTTWNAGLDLAFLNNRIEFNFDWYYRKTTDLINTVFVAAGSNFRNKVTSNIGSLHNTGIEFMTTVRPIQNKDWRWDVSYNFTYNHNEIDELIDGVSDDYFVETGGGLTGTGGNIQAHTVGKPISSSPSVLSMFTSRFTTRTASLSPTHLLTATAMAILTVATATIITSQLLTC